MDRLLFKIGNSFKYIMICILCKIVGVILNLFPLSVAITNGRMVITGLGNGHINILSNVRWQIVV